MSILRPILHCLHNEGALWSEIATGFWVLYWLTKNYDWKQIEVGDLGNVTAGEDGRASFRLTDRLVKVIFCFFGVSPWSEILISVVSLANQVWDVIGRSVVVASKPDDLGLGSAPTSSLWVQSHYHGHHSQLQPSFIIYNTYLDSWLCYSICQGWQLWNRGGLWDYREKRWTGREHETDLCMWWGQCHFNPISNTLVSSRTLCVIRTPYSILLYPAGDYLGREKQTSSWTWSSSMITTFHNLCDKSYEISRPSAYSNLIACNSTVILQPEEQNIQC